MANFMNRFLEELVQDVHVDLESEEIKDIRDSVNELMRRCLADVENASPYFKSTNIVPCGSMAEGTRIWKFSEDNMTAILEFDFLARLQCFTPGSFRAETSCGGFMQVEDNSLRLPRRYTNDDDENGTVGKLSAKEVSFNFRLNMMKSVSGLCGCYEFETDSRYVKGIEVVTLKCARKTNKFREECDRCKIRKATGTLVFATGYEFHPVELNCTIVFLWVRNQDMSMKTPCENSRQKVNINKDFLILIDFLPAIELINNEPMTENRNSASVPGKEADIQTQSCLSRQCFLVPKCCRNEQHSTCWKVSHCLFEIHLLQCTSRVHRQCYMVLKFIFDYLLADMGKVRGAPTTYVLKTAVLHHIQTCQNQNADLTQCISSIIKYLSAAHENACLPHLILKDQNFLTAPSMLKDFYFAQEHLSWSKNRNVILAKFWAFMLRALENMETIIGPAYDSDKIQTAVKLITTKYGIAYASTTFKVMHIPHEDEFLEVLSKILHDENISRETFENITKVYGDVEGTWEENLPHDLHISAYLLYTQMQQRCPDVIQDGALQIKPPVITLYSRKES